MRFKAGQKVWYKRSVVEILSGPHQSPGLARYLIREVDGDVSLVEVSELSLLHPQREEIARELAEWFYVCGWERLGDERRGIVYNATDAVLMILEQGGLASG